MSNKFEKELEKFRNEIAALITDEEKLAYALKFVRKFDELNRIGDVGPGVRIIVEEDLETLENGSVERAKEILDEIAVGEYAL